MREKNNLKEDTIRGTMFGALERFSVMGLQVICTFIVARFLTPSDFGLIGLLIVFTVIGNTIMDSGFGQALIREKEVSDLEYSSVFYLNVFLSLIVYFLLFVSSGFIADFYKESSLKNIARVTFLVIPLNAFAVIQNTILIRKVDFKKIFPFFILYFLLASIITTIAVNLGVPADTFAPLKTLSKFLIVLAMTAIGLNTNIVKLIKSLVAFITRRTNGKSAMIQNKIQIMVRKTF